MSNDPQTISKAKFLELVAKKKWTKRDTIQIPAMYNVELKAAGIMFAISNCGFLSGRQEKELFTKHGDNMDSLLKAVEGLAYSIFQDDESWNGFQAEKRDWISKFRDHDAFCLHEWYKSRYEMAGLIPKFVA